jgi:hypothetical protein
MPDDPVDRAAGNEDLQSGRDRETAQRSPATEKPPRGYGA